MAKYELYDSIFEPICVINNDNEIVYYNHFFASFFKKSPRVLKKSPKLSTLFTGFDIEDFLEDMNDVKVGPEVEIFLEDQTFYHVIIKAIESDNNEKVICFNDISIEKNLYTKYRYQIEELKQIHNQIIQADKLSTIGEITATISHEISNPLTIASGNIELISVLLAGEELKENDIIHESISDTRESIDRITKIVKGLKSFLHNRESDKKFITLEDIINKSLTLLKLPLEQNQISLDFNVNTSSIVKVNPIEIEQVIINLVTNAIHALGEVNTKDPKISLSISSNDVCYIITVKDNGRGIPEENRGKIFDSFFTTKEVGEGTGLGLSISSKIIDSYSGSLELIDTKTGCEFQITLPKMETTTFTDSELSVNHSFQKVLIIDNEPKILNLFTNFFAKGPITLIFASSAIEAKRILEGTDVDAIITDYDMPNMNGVEFAKDIIKNGLNTPTFVMSGVADKSKFDNHKEIKGFIEKPFNREDILNMLGIKNEEQD
ncbi:ATP-binding protein [Halobacteriovorax sp. RT-1-4]|uniref:ATP-binding protein n=1 Tax=unclassified Halobacteriovorax TaxID=2639665 RepID=UPI00399C0447